MNRATCPRYQREAPQSPLATRAVATQKLAAVSHRRRAIEYSTQKAHRKAKTQAKIVFGAGAKEYLDTHPRD